MPHQAKSSTALMGTGLLLYLSSILFLIASFESVESRYLPTRADETDVEVLRELIKELLTQSNLDQFESRLNRIQQQQIKNADQYYRLLAANQLQMDRRALETPVSSLGDNRQRRSIIG